MKKNNFDKNKYYVFATGWNGMTKDDVFFEEPDVICNTFEDAIKTINRLWETTLEEDEGCYLYHNGKLLSEFDNEINDLIIK